MKKAPFVAAAFFALAPAAHAEEAGSRPQPVVCRGDADSVVNQLHGRPEIVQLQLHFAEHAQDVRVLRVLRQQAAQYGLRFPVFLLLHQKDRALEQLVVHAIS